MTDSQVLGSELRMSFFELGAVFEAILGVDVICTISLYL